MQETSADEKLNNLFDLLVERVQKNLQLNGHFRPHKARKAYRRYSPGAT